MSPRWCSARPALLGLVGILCLPLLTLAKPPDLPLRPQVECAATAVAAPASYRHAPELLLPDTTVYEQFIGTFCPGIEDALEAGWRTLLRWLPVSEVSRCCHEPTTRLAVIEVLPVAPSLYLAELINENFISAPLGYVLEQATANDQQAGVREYPQCQWLGLFDACKDCCPLQLLGLRTRCGANNLQQTAATEQPAKLEKRSRIEIKVTIEVTRP